MNRDEMLAEVRALAEKYFPKSPDIVQEIEYRFESTADEGETVYPSASVAFYDIMNELLDVCESNIAYEGTDEEMRRECRKDQKHIRKALIGLGVYTEVTPEMLPTIYSTNGKKYEFIMDKKMWEFSDHPAEWKKWREALSDLDDGDEDGE